MAEVDQVLTVFFSAFLCLHYSATHYSANIRSALMRNLVLSVVSILLPFGVSCFAAEKIVLVAGGGSSTAAVPAKDAKLVAPFGIDFDKSGNAFLVELVGGRLLKIDTQGTLIPLGGHEEKGNVGDGGLVKDAAFNGMHSLA
ncbi:MAG: hypothetical protein K8R36_23835, partial [Planctomycetales bacterium]|nr:hypothetical protein [Planctomycetales bacterium]